LRGQELLDLIQVKESFFSRNVPVEPKPPGAVSPARGIFLTRSRATTSREPSRPSSEITNLQFFTEHLRLDRWFDVAKIVYDDGIRPGKPAPDVYLAAARNIGIAPSECVVIEDAVSGLAAAYAAGIGYIVAIGAPAEFPRLLACDGVAVAIESLRDFPREQLLLDQT